MIKAKNSLIIILLCASASLLYYCASGSGGSEEGVVIGTFTQIPVVSEIVSVGEPESSINISKAVVGAPPYLKDIDQNNADNYFWNGLVSDVIAAGEVTSQEEADDVFNGMGSCQMANTAYFSLINLQSESISSCYLKRIPEMSANVITFQTLPEDTTLATLFDQRDADRVIKISPIDGPGNDASIFLKVYGSSSTESKNGYAIDLWFCPVGSTTIRQYQKIRINSSERIMSQEDYNLEDGSEYLVLFNGILKKDSSDNIVFDNASAQEAIVIDSGDNHGTKTGISVLHNTLTLKGHGLYTSGTGTTYSNKYSYSIGTYSGNTMDTVAFQSGAYAVQDNKNSINYDNAMEFKSSWYNYVGSAGEHYADVHDYNFVEDNFYESNVVIDPSYAETARSFSCSTSADVVGTMDMGSSEFAPILAECEADWSGLNYFCDSNDIYSAEGMAIEFVQ